ncbi:cytoplasmic protein [Escherichia coli]|nr:cytoplasmic protein [Escherichia coli]EFB6855773.1 cytoplasmic protein [Escherichia coli]EFN5116635.1 cytoplasmic protein [Escherichia coli]
MPEHSLILSSPVKGFSDNKRHSFHPSGRVFSGRRGFFIYYTSKS